MDDKMYMCSPNTYSIGFTDLMKLVSDKTKISEIIEYVKKYPEELNKQNDEGWTALMIAARNSNTFSSEEIVKILIDAGSDLEIKTSGYKNTALGLAAANSNCDSTFKTVEMLIHAGANVNHKNDSERTVLLHALENINRSNFETIKLLIDSKCQLSFDFLAHNELMLLVYRINIDTHPNYEDFVHELTRYGIDINLQDRHGDTALMLAARYRKEEKIIRTLLDLGCDYTIINKNNESFFDIIERNHWIPNDFLNEIYSMIKDKSIFDTIYRSKERNFYKLMLSEKNNIIDDLQSEVKALRMQIELYPESKHILELADEFRRKLKSKMLK